MPTKGPFSFDMLFSRSSSSSRSRYAFTPPLGRSDTEESMNPKSLFEIRAFAQALQHLHGSTQAESDSSEDPERKRRTLKSARMRPATSASSSGSGPFRSTSRFPRSPYPDGRNSIWGLWDQPDHNKNERTTASSGASSPNFPSSVWLGSANTSSTSVVQGKQDHKRNSSAKWVNADVSIRSPQMVSGHSSAGRSLCGQLETEITLNHEALPSLSLGTGDPSTGQDDFTRDIYKRLKDIMGVDPVTWHPSTNNEVKASV